MPIKHRALGAKPSAANGARRRGEPEGRSKPRDVRHFTPEERAARGKAERADTPRSAHGDWEPSPKRRDPVDLLEEQGKTRVRELLPIRYGRMLVSPFTFYRGAAYLMAADLADGPRTSLHAQLCGDAHLSNFGAFATPDRRLVLSINDFDETLPGPFEWDLKRLAASFAVAGRDRGFDDHERAAITSSTARAYREAMADFAGKRNLDVWYARLEVDEILPRFVPTATAKERKRVEAIVAKARTKDSLKALGKLTEIVDGDVRIVSDPPLIVPVEEIVSGKELQRLQEAIRNAVRSYRTSLLADRNHLLKQFRYVHAARKVVGVGSVGTRAWILLLLGRDDNDPLFLQFKEAEASVLEPFLGKSQYDNHGQRVVEGQRLMQASSDIMLGWLRVDSIDGVSREFYVRQLWDQKASAPVDTMDMRAMGFYAEVCGWSLAKAHARSGDPIAISSYLGKSSAFDRAMASFAEAYANQNERDYQALKKAVASGRVKAKAGV